MSVIHCSKQPPYSLKSLVSCQPPFESVENNWFEYQILQGSNIIIGYKCGDYNDVLESIQINIDQLNQRQKGKYGNMNISKAKS